MKDVRASIAIAPSAVVAVVLGACFGACTSGATPDCDGGVCGYGNAETGPEEAGEGGPDGSTTADTGALVDGTGQ